MSILSASHDQSCTLAQGHATLDSRDRKVVRRDVVQLVDMDGLTVLLEIEVSDEFSAILCFLVATFEAVLF